MFYIVRFVSFILAIWGYLLSFAGDKVNVIYKCGDDLYASFEGGMPSKYFCYDKLVRFSQNSISVDSILLIGAIANFETNPTIYDSRKDWCVVDSSLFVLQNSSSLSLGSGNVSNLYFNLAWNNRGVLWNGDSSGFKNKSPLPINIKAKKYDKNYDVASVYMQSDFAVVHNHTSLNIYYKYDYSSGDSMWIRKERVVSDWKNGVYKESEMMVDVYVLKQKDDNYHIFQMNGIDYLILEGDMSVYNLQNEQGEYISRRVYDANSWIGPWMRELSARRVRIVPECVGYFKPNDNYNYFLIDSFTDEVTSNMEFVPARKEYEGLFGNMIKKSDSINRRIREVRRKVGNEK